MKSESGRTYIKAPIYTVGAFTFYICYICLDNREITVNEENLKPFKKGQTGNPNGRPKGRRNRATVARQWLEVVQNLKNPLTQQFEDLDQQDLMTLALIKKAREGDVAAYKALMDSGYGMPTQSVEVENKNPIFTGIDLSVLPPKEK